MDQIEVPAPLWVLGQWWRLQVTNSIDQTPRYFLHRVVEVRAEGYVVQVTNEATGTITTVLRSKELNFISNSVPGYRTPSMVIETKPDDGKFEFPLKVGSKWERRYTISNNGDAGMPTVVRGHVVRAVDLDTSFGRRKTLEIMLWWKPEGAVSYQATCKYLSEIGRCVEYYEGLQTAKVVEVGIER